SGMAHWTPGKGDFDPPPEVMHAFLVDVVADARARAELMKGASELAARGFESAAAEAARGLASPELGVTPVKAFDSAAEEIGSFYGLLGDSLLDAIGKKAEARSAFVSILGTSVQLAKIAADTTPLTG